LFRSKIIKNTGIYTLGNLLPKIGILLLLPIITKYLSPEEYGIVQSLVILQTFLLILFTLAVDRAIFRLYFDFPTKNSQRDYLGSIFISHLIIACSMLFIIYSFDFLFGKIYKSIPFYPYFSYFVLSVFFTSFEIIPKTYFQVTQKAKFHFLYSLSQFILRYSFVLWFVIAKDEGAEGMLKGMMYGSLILFPALLYNNFKIVNLKFKKAYIFNSLKYSFPLIPSLLAAWMLNFSDRVFLERYFTTTEVGLYSLGYQIAMVVGYINQGVRKAYSPVFFSLANYSDKSIAKPKIKKMNETILYLFVSLIFFISVFSKEIITWFFDSQYLQAYKIIPIIALTYIFIIASSLFNLSIYQTKRTYITMIITLFTAGINVLLNFLLIPIYSMYGAAISTLFSFMINAFLTYYYSRKEYFISLNLKSFIAYFFSLFLIAFTLLYIIKIKFILMFILKLIIIIGICFYFYIKYRKYIADIIFKRK